jgi:hypothetical protein
MKEKTRPWRSQGRGDTGYETWWKGSIFLSLLGEPLAGRFVDPLGALVFLADLLDETASHEVLQLLVSAEAEHFLATADGVAEFQVVKHSFEEVVEAKDLVFRENVAEFVRDVIGKPA